MKRKIYDKLCDWKRDGAGKTALLIDGALIFDTLKKVKLSFPYS